MSERTLTNFLLLVLFGVIVAAGVLMLVAVFDTDLDNGLGNYVTFPPGYELVTASRSTDAPYICRNIETGEYRYCEPVAKASEETR